MRKSLALIVSLLIPTGLLIALPHASAATNSVTIVAVGDIAYTDSGSQKYTAALTKALKPQAVLLMGDLAYGAKGKAATTTNFNTKFLPKWRSVLARYPTYAVPGNHEYGPNTVASAYLKVVKKYKLPRTGEETWWVKKRGAWTLIGLDSEGISAGGSNCSGSLTAKGVRQMAFLQSALASNNGRPTLVTWHRPRFSSGEHLDQKDEGVCRLWDTVKADTDVKLVLWGHDHNYERVSNLSNQPTTFVVGTGGAKLRTCPGVTANTKSLICGAGTKTKPNYGVLKLTLRSTSFSWEFRQVTKNKKKGRISDSGTKQFS